MSNFVINPYIVSPPAPCNFDYDYTCGADQNTIGNSGYEQYAIRNITGTDTTVATATWYFRRHTSGGTPTGTAQAHIYSTDGSTLLDSSDTQSVTGIGALADNCTITGTAIVFTFSPATLWADDYYLTIKYTDGSDRLGVLNSSCVVGTCTSPSGFTYHFGDAGSWSSSSYFLNCVTSCT
jgi:hypothetical protein